MHFLSLPVSQHMPIQKVLTLTTFFFNAVLVVEGREDPNTTISIPTSARQRNTIGWPSIECWLGSLVNVRGSRSPYGFVFYRGGGGGGGGGALSPLSPPLDPCVLSTLS